MLWPQHFLPTSKKLLKQSLKQNFAILLTLKFGAAIDDLWTTLLRAFCSFKAFEVKRQVITSLHLSELHVMNGFFKECLSWWARFLFLFFNFYESSFWGDANPVLQFRLFSGMDPESSGMLGAKHWLPQPPQADQRLANEWSTGSLHNR